MTAFMVFAGSVGLGVILAVLDGAPGAKNAGLAADVPVNHKPANHKSVRIARAAPPDAAVNGYRIAARPLRPSELAAIAPAAGPKSAARPGLSQPAWIRNAALAPPVTGRPIIAIIIDDMGIDRAASAKAVALPGPLTLAYLPYARGLGAQTKTARDAGHELLVHIPMEPFDRTEDPGPNALRVDLERNSLLDRLRWGLSRVDGHVGINNHMGSRFTSDARAMATVMAELKSRGLLFLDSRTSGKTVGTDLARSMGVPHAERSVFLDNSSRSDAIRARFNELEHIARTKGVAVAIGHPRPATLRALAKWLQVANERGFDLVPLTAVIRHRTRIACAAGGC